jgi:metallo-beta-lactamase family protein
VISHAHIDHIGRVPLLVQRGFRGPIYAQAATADLMPIMLLDAASIAEGDAERANRHRGDGEPEAVPLYTSHDVAAALKQLRVLPYDSRETILPGIDIVFRDAGHILGSAVVEVFADERKLVFSGDLGPKGTPILRDPVAIDRADLVLMESTYGDRNHRDRADTIAELGGILDTAWREGGNVLVPAFAVGRTQELLYWFARYWDEWKLSRWRIFLDSPMAAKVVAVYDRNADLFDEDAKGIWAAYPNPFRLPNLHTTRTPQESMAINRIQSGAIVVAGSGMANAGRILHHLKHRLSRRETHVVFVGYQAEGTLGRRIVERHAEVNIFGEPYRLRAEVVTLNSLSGHADKDDLFAYARTVKEASPNLKQVFLVHGEQASRADLGGRLRGELGLDVVCPELGERHFLTDKAPERAV